MSGFSGGYVETFLPPQAERPMLWKSLAFGVVMPLIQMVLVQSVPKVASWAIAIFVATIAADLIPPRPASTRFATTIAWAALAAVAGAAVAYAVDRFL